MLLSAKLPVGWTPNDVQIFALSSLDDWEFCNGWCCNNRVWCSYVWKWSLYLARIRAGCFTRNTREIHIFHCIIPSGSVPNWLGFRSARDAPTRTRVLAWPPFSPVNGTSPLWSDIPTGPMRVHSFWYIRRSLSKSQLPFATPFGQPRIKLRCELGTACQSATAVLKGGALFRTLGNKVILGNFFLRNCRADLFQTFRVF